MFDDLAFNAEEFSSMPVSERVKLCRLLAVRARQLAELGGPRYRDAYLRIANEWDTLGYEIEQHG
jgi:hypothetical protein